MAKAGFLIMHGIREVVIGWDSRSDGRHERVISIFKEEDIEDPTLQITLTGSKEKPIPVRRQKDD